jgi:proteic killer suppression protein
MVKKLAFVRLYGTIERAVVVVILSFRDHWLEQFYRDDKRSKRIPADAGDRVFRKLQLIDDAIADLDLRTPPSNHFEKLRGKLDGWYSIRVSDSWRLIFQWNGGRGEASNVYLDNHRYR